MKTVFQQFSQLFNTVKKSNDFKSTLFYLATSSTYFINKLMRILNY